MSDEIKNSFYNPLYIPKEFIPDGWEYRWIRTAICGEPDILRMRDANNIGYTPVPAERHPTLHNNGEYITYNDLILCEIPKCITEEICTIKDIVGYTPVPAECGEDEIINLIFLTKSIPEMIAEITIVNTFEFKSICIDKFEGWKSPEIFYDEEKQGWVVTGVKDLQKPIPKNVDIHPESEGWRKVEIWYKFSKEELAIIDEFEKPYMSEPNYKSQYIQEKIKQLEIYKDFIIKMKESGDKVAVIKQNNI